MKRNSTGARDIFFLKAGCAPAVAALFFFSSGIVPIATHVSFAQAVAVQQTPKAQKQPSPQQPTYGQAIFSRGTATAPQNLQANPAQPAALQPEAASTRLVSSAAAFVSDQERAALIFRSYNFEIHLTPVQHSIAVRAHMSIENSSDHPLSRIALQISSALHWESIRINGSSKQFQVEQVESDIDHTGQLTEAVMPLASPLSAGATIQLDVLYSGTIQQSSERLLRLGAPAKIASSSEWDRIGPDFTALRGFGNVIWFPVSTVPVLLGQGPEMFDSVGQWKLRESAAQVSMHVSVEYLNEKPTVAFLNGTVMEADHSTAETGSSTVAADAVQNGIPRIVSFTLPSTQLGFAPLSFFVMDGRLQHFSGIDIYTRPGNASVAEAYQKIAEEDRPPVEQWLGARPKRPVTLVDLPDSDDLPFEARNLLFLPLQANVVSDQIAPVLSHMLGHAYFTSPRPWLNEGIAQLMTLFWIEQRAGRAAAISEMDSHRAALALEETSDPGTTPGQSLVDAWSDIYYRNKAVDVLWMLRDITGDTVFSSALQAYDPAKDHEASYFQRLLEKSSGKDLEWFFDDWVYRDRGLPDLEIVSAYWRPILTKNSATHNYLVSVDIQNDSFCSAEVPVTVEAVSSSQTKRLLVPSHSHANLRMLLDSKPYQVIVNDGSVPEVRTSRHEQAIQAAQ